MKRSSPEVWLWLLLVMNPHNPRTCQILEHYNSAEEAARAMRDGEVKLNEAERQRVKNIRMREVRQLVEECSKYNIRIITLDDPEYPPMLKNIFSPPIVLFVRGTLSVLSGEVPLAVVGPRNPTDYAVRIANKLCGDLASIGTIMVSGLAVGIDTIAHTCAVDAGVPTIGVMGCGIMVNYPIENEMLKCRIIEGGGALVSELLPHAGVASAYFNIRNRIISGLGLGTLIIEASTRSGCLLTANHAIEQGRDLFCVPPSDITAEYCAGVIPFLRDGAIPVFDYLDIVHEYMFHYYNRLDSSAQKGEKPRKPKTERTDNNKKKEKSTPAEELKQTAENTENNGKSEQIPENTEPQTKLTEELLSELTENQAALLKAIAEQKLSADELVEQTEISFSDTAECLTELEILGYIELLPDGKYTLK